jgi:hypothetical protein
MINYKDTKEKEMTLLEKFMQIMNGIYDRPLDKGIACHKFLEANYEELYKLFGGGNFNA